MLNQSPAGLHQSLVQAGQRPIFDPGWYGQSPPQVAQVVGKNAEPQPNLIAAQEVPTQPCRHTLHLAGLWSPQFERSPKVQYMTVLF
jgi:hypothetical protein